MITWVLCVTGVTVSPESSSKPSSALGMSHLVMLFWHGNKSLWVAFSGKHGGGQGSVLLLLANAVPTIYAQLLSRNVIKGNSFVCLEVKGIFLRLQAQISILEAHVILFLWSRGCEVLALFSKLVTMFTDGSSID